MITSSDLFGEGWWRRVGVKRGCGEEGWASRHRFPFNSSALSVVRLSNSYLIPFPMWRRRRSHTRLGTRSTTEVPTKWMLTKWSSLVLTIQAVRVIIIDGMLKLIQSRSQNLLVWWTYFITAYSMTSPEKRLLQCKIVFLVCEEFSSGGIAFLDEFVGYVHGFFH